MTIQRLNRLLSLLQSNGLDALVLNPGQTMTYLSGLNLHIMERPSVLIVSANGMCAVVLAELEKIKLTTTTIPVQGFTYGDNPATWSAAFRQAFEYLHLDKAKIGVEPTHLRVLELRFLEEAAPNASFVSAESAVTELRILKEPEEIAIMRKAVEIAQNAFKATVPMIQAGVSEREIGSELNIQLLRHGSDAEFPFAPIVAGGPNSANPHAFLSERKLIPGDLLVIDWGASYKGYVSDLTRTLAIGKVDPEYEKIASIVLEANTAGRNTSRAGIPAGQVDQAAREVISKAGYGPQFTHRVGHGIGMEGHEPPYIFGENRLILKPGMCHTVEPGIYLAGRGGVRIEDDVVVTETGAESLSNLPRELMHIA
ncbi:MAG: Xaa-Pro peptidase family protein [Anaerolineaceae bacterium]|nr:Xaa-Pro peptidase family protein [Anaerolineaceae bacterium]